jgi:hypothetical protein
VIAARSVLGENICLDLMAHRHIELHIDGMERQVEVGYDRDAGDRCGSIPYNLE